MTKNIYWKKIMTTFISSGKHFRPGNWPERLASLDATFVNNKLQYSDNLKPCMIESDKALCFKDGLHPDLIKYILEFAKENNLRVTKK